MGKTLVLYRANPKSPKTLIPMTLVEWATYFNEANRLTKPVSK